MRRSAHLSLSLGGIIQVPKKFNLRQARHIRKRIVLKGFQAERATKIDHRSLVINPCKAPIALHILAANHTDGRVILITDCVFDVHSASLSEPMPWLRLLAVTMLSSPAGEDSFARPSTSNPVLDQSCKRILTNGFINLS